MHLARSTRLAALVRHLPFDVDDFDAAREAFVRWQETESEADKKVAQLWAYCYVVWYFYGKFAREREARPSDLDRVVERATKRVFRAMEREAIREPDRFPQFVSVVCRNLLSSYRARRRETVEFEDAAVPVAAAGAGEYDRVLIRNVVVRAIEALPPSIGEVVRMRLLEGKSYPEIAEATGRPLASTRTYYSKAIRRLRDDPHLRALYEGAGPDLTDADPGPRDPALSGLTADQEMSVEASSEVRSGPSAGLRP